MLSLPIRSIVGLQNALVITGKKSLLNQIHVARVSRLPYRRSLRYSEIHYIFTVSVPLIIVIPNIPLPTAQWVIGNRK